MKSVKVIFHINEADKWTQLLANVSNLLKVVDLSVSSINILVNSKAAIMFDEQNLVTSPIDQGQADQVKELAEQGVKITLCRNTLKGLGIAEESIPVYVDVVPVGVLELIEKQADGFAYIKP